MAKMITTLVNHLGTVFDSEKKLERVDNIVTGMDKFKKISALLKSANNSMEKAMKVFREANVTQDEVKQMYDIFVTMLTAEQTAVLKAANKKDFENLPKVLKKIHDSAKILKKFADLGKKKEEIAAGVALFLN